MSINSNMVKIDDGSFEVHFSPVQVSKRRYVEIEVVLDLNREGKVIGIEIINLVYYIKKQYQFNSFLLNKFFPKSDRMFILVTIKMQMPSI